MSQQGTPLLGRIKIEKTTQDNEFDRFWDHNELRSAKLWRATFAELLGTFSFFVIGLGADIIYHHNPLVVAAAWGLSLTALIFVFEEISGAQFNPANSFTSFLVGDISFLRLCFFASAQFLAGILSVGLLRATIPDETRNDPVVHLGANKVESGGTFNAMLVEVVLTFFLIYIDFAITRNPVQPKVVKKVAAPFAIGSIMGACVIFGFNITGPSLNPARSFGTALISGYWRDHWIFWVGPLLGSVAAAVVFKAFLYGNDNKSDEFGVRNTSERERLV